MGNVNYGKDDLIESLSNFWRLWRKIVYAPVKKGEVSLEQYWILLYLKKHGPKNVHQLSEFLGTTPSSITLITKKMEKSNFVQRVRGEPDDRTVTIIITAHGKETWEAWQKKRDEAIVGILSPLSEKEKDILNQLIKKILAESHEEQIGKNDFSK
ncbi:MAG: MarR family transcriptional regulator [Nitrososphaeria archaeon]